MALKLETDTVTDTAGVLTAYMQIKDEDGAIVKTKAFTFDAEAPEAGVEAELEAWYEQNVDGRQARIDLAKTRLAGMIVRIEGSVAAKVAAKKAAADAIANRKEGHE